MTNAEFLDSLATETVQERLAELDRMPAKDVIAMYTPYRMCDSDLGEWLSGLTLTQLWHLRMSHHWAVEIVYLKMSRKLQVAAYSLGAKFPQDAVDETIFRAWREKALPECLESWMRTVLCNIVRSEHRKHGSRESSLDSALELGRQFGVNAEEHHTDLERCLGTLNDGEKQVVYLHHIAGYSYAEVATIRATKSAAAEEQRSVRAMAKLRKCLKVHGVGGQR